MDTTSLEQKAAAGSHRSDTQSISIYPTVSTFIAYAFSAEEGILSDAT